MTAKNAGDSTISGTVFEKYTAGSNTLKFRYRITCDNPNKCQVGGLSPLYLSAPAPTSLDQSGCVSTDHPIRCVATVCVCVGGG